MVNILSLFITCTTLAVLSPVAQAGACKEDTLNCGSTLKRKPMATYCAVSIPRLSRS
ncbi:hypothetical protein E4U23_004573 [Claviceps purpurea]|nr:hypothetical protein E4U23_004573 [Claviceps purpurea]